MTGIIMENNSDNQNYKKAKKDLNSVLRYILGYFYEIIVDYLSEFNFYDLPYYLLAIAILSPFLGILFFFGIQTSLSLFQYGLILTGKFLYYLLRCLVLMQFFFLKIILSVFDSIQKNLSVLSEILYKNLVNVPKKFGKCTKKIFFK